MAVHSDDAKAAPIFVRRTRSVIGLITTPRQ